MAVRSERTSLCIDLNPPFFALMGRLKLNLEWKHMRYLFIVISLLSLTACSTVLAVADTVGTVAVYGAKTIVNTVDAITPDLVNKKKD